MDDEMKSYGDMLAEAATHLQVALELLDRARAPAHIGAHVDLAAHELHHQLRRAMAPSVEPPSQAGQALQ